VKTQSPSIPLILITLFTIALAVAVAWISITATPPPLGSTELSVLSTVLPTVSTEPSEPPVEELTSRGLLFSPTGDGTCTLAGLGTCTDSSVVVPTYAPTGERVTAIAPMAFYGTQGVSAVQIPASVTEIGALAFADCTELAYVAVHPDNPAFCDREGVLYSVDQATLIIYPPKHTGNEIHISATTVRILDMAFYRCDYLLHVRYGGTAAEWELIRIGTRNYALIAAAKEFEAG
jgi:hypothetical protein